MNRDTFDGKQWHNEAIRLAEELAEARTEIVDLREEIEDLNWRLAEAEAEEKT